MYARSSLGWGSLEALFSPRETADIPVDAPRMFNRPFGTFGLVRLATQRRPCVHGARAALFSTAPPGQRHVQPTALRRAYDGRAVPMPCS